MTNSQRLAQVRERLLHWLADKPAEDSEAETATIIGESILIVDGFYAGRRFDAGRYQAIWFMEEDELKIHAAAGELLDVLAGDQLAPASTVEADSSEGSHVMILRKSDADVSDAEASEDNFRRAA